MRAPFFTLPRRLNLSWLLLFAGWSVLWLPTRAFCADAPPPNLVTNPGFESNVRPTDNLWDGVDSDGYLDGFKFSAQVVMDRGALGALAMPPCVAMADLNGDGKPDLLTADPSGYFHFYPNHGTATEPHFTSAELLPVFLSTAFKPRQHIWDDKNADGARFCPRFALADWRHSGLLDLLICNYFGETLFLPNVGTARAAAFRQPTGPAGIASARLITSEREPFWGNLFTPVAADLSHDGHLDLLIGEGTYSANSIHLLRNTGTATPKFSDAQHTQIAYGDGREQLMPTVVDYDGDGNIDLLIADRSGEVGVYLNPGKTQPPGSEFKRTATISFGGRAKLSGLCSLCAADFNGDGLFDIILGLSTGHIAVALNTGAKGNPVFGPMQELKGEDHFGRNINVADGWNVSTHSEYGNALAYITVVDAQSDTASQPPEGGHCMKAGYWPLTGDTFQIPPEGIPGAERHFVLYHPGITLENNKAYELSFRVKGAGMEKMHYSFASFFQGTPGLVKIERGERGEMKNKQEYVEERVNIGENFNAGSNWASAGGTLNIRYQSPLLKERPTQTGAIYIDFWATNQSSALYLDDFKLVLKK